MTPPSSGSAGPWPEVLAIVGPTASGKSALALELADLIGGEIVNADAFQVYRGMDVGTAKPSASDRARIPHHLVDLLDVTEEMSVAQFQVVGRAVLGELATRGVPAVVVGGSGLYVRALLDDLRFPGSDPSIRARWEEELARIGPHRLHAELAMRDPAAGAQILPSNGRRIVRALEVGELTGLPFPATLPVDGPPLVPHRSFGLDMDREVLDGRVERRVDEMFDAGLVQEVSDLLGRGLRQGRTASRALGYPDVIALLDGAIDAPTARRQIIDGTRALARRQQRWFARDPRTVWLPGGADPVSTARVIADLGERSRT